MSPTEEYYWYQVLVLTVVCIIFLVLDVYTLYKLSKTDADGNKEYLIVLAVVGLFLTVEVVTELPKVFAYEGYVQIQNNNLY